MTVEGKPPKGVIKRKRVGNGFTTKRSETTLMREILLAIGAVPGLAVWRAAVGVGYVKTGGQYKPIRFGGVPGQPDILGCYKGRFVGMEVKTPHGRLSAEQIAWAQAITRAGGAWFCVRSPEDAFAALKQMDAEGVSWAHQPGSMSAINSVSAVETADATLPR